jgi:hypothetical protein
MTPKKIPTVSNKHRDRLDFVKTPTIQFIKTKEEWLSLDVVIQPADIFLLERSEEDGSIRIKVSDGIHKYADLPYIVNHVLTDELYALLVNNNRANGVLVLNEQTKIPESFLPTIYTGRVKVANTYSEMISRGEDINTGYKFKQGPVIVLDATDDPSGTIQNGGAYYVWVEDLDTPQWIKISEFQEPEVSLEEYFKYRGNNRLTIGSIEDDVYNTNTDPRFQYKKFSYADAEKLYSIVNDNSTINVQYTHAIFCTEIDMAKYSQILTIGA